MTRQTDRIRNSAGQAVGVEAGTLRVVALADGHLDLDMSRFPDVDRAIGDELAAKADIDLDDLALSVTAFLVDGGERLYLIDAGNGRIRGPGLGHLPRALKRAGYDPEDVTDLLMTHLHGDHAAGLYDGERPVFPNARLVVTAEERRFWLAPAEHNQFQAMQAGFATTAMRVYRERLEIATPGVALAPGIEPVALPGHTPGQAGYLVGTDDPVLIAGDTMHLPALQVLHPEWGFLFDADGATAHATRVRVLDEFAASGRRLACAHLPFPSIGRIDAREDGRRYVPVAD